MDILICQDMDQAKICTQQPVYICHNSSFVVDQTTLDDPDDLKADENGVWKRKGSPQSLTSAYTIIGTKRKVYRRSQMGSTIHHYKITRTYYHHSSSPDFRRTIVTVHSKHHVCALLIIRCLQQYTYNYYIVCYFVFHYCLLFVRLQE